MFRVNAVRISMCAAALWVAVSFSTGTLLSQDAGKSAKIDLADGKLLLTAPAEWKSVPPKSSIVQYEFMAPKDEANVDKQVRITIMQSGGGVEPNIQRWYGQFTQPDGSSTKDKSKVETFKVAGQSVHFVDVSGTFADSMGGGGPNAPAKKVVNRDNYRMLGAIIETEGSGMYFVKATGPKDAIEKLKDGMRKMLDGIEAKK